METRINELFNWWDSYISTEASSINKNEIIDGESIKLDLLGAKKENISVDVSGQIITVKSTKKNIYGQNTKFERSYQLDEKYDTKSLKAKYEDGILSISADVKESRKPRKIEID